MIAYKFALEFNFEDILSPLTAESRLVLPNDRARYARKIMEDEAYFQHFGNRPLSVWK